MSVLVLSYYSLLLLSYLLIITLHYKIFNFIILLFHNPVCFLKRDRKGVSLDVDVAGKQ